MKDVKKCSISGIAFTLEMDAWEELSRYLEELRNQYKENPDGEEILADIEARIAELILSTQDNHRTVALPLIKNIITQMGSADEIEAESSTEESSTQEYASTQKRGKEKQGPRIPRRLYRDAEASKLGGVCAGLGKYFDIDPVWIRLALFAPIVIHFLLQSWWNPEWFNSLMMNIFSIIVFTYMIMWFCIPTARSARQKLEMKGEKITAESIRRTTELRNDVDGRPKAIVADTVSTFGKVIQILLKLFAGVIMMGLVFFACALIVGGLALFFSAEAAAALANYNDLSIWIPELAILAILIPCMLLIYVLMCLIVSSRPKGKNILITLIVWIVVVILLFSLSLREGMHEKIRQELLPAPSYNSLNLLNDPSSIYEEAVETHEEEEKVENIQSEKGSSPGIQIKTPEEEIDIKLTSRGMKIDVKETESGQTEEISIDVTGGE